ncbi:hypothetical protein KY334_05205 [Candidatus Woesearchaeota archaeon]|nr:hypothetical protein [Candidatus Woesearchaeota archaeon]
MELKIGDKVQVGDEILEVVPFSKGFKKYKKAYKKLIDSNNNLKLGMLPKFQIFLVKF